MRPRERPPASAASAASRQWPRHAAGSSMSVLVLLHFLIEGVLLCGVCVFGLAANAVSTWVLVTSKDLDLTDTFVHILVALMAFDSIFLAGFFTIYSLPQLLGSFYANEVFPRIVPYVLPIIQISLTGSVYMTMSVSVERYLSLRSVLKSLETPRANTTPVPARSPVNGNATSNANAVNAADRSPVVNSDHSLLFASQHEGESVMMSSNGHLAPAAPSAPNAVSNAAAAASIADRISTPCCFRFSAPRRARTYIVPVVIFSVLYNVTRFFELRTATFSVVRNVTMRPEEALLLDEDWAGLNSAVVHWRNETVVVAQRNVSGVTVAMRPLRSDPTYIRDYLLFTNLFFMALLPLFVLVGVNRGLYRMLRSRSLASSHLHSRARRDRTVAAMFAVIVTVFVFCHTFKLGITLYECVVIFLEGDYASQWPEWTKPVTGLNHLLLATNSAVNFLIYCWKDRKFRAALKNRFKLSCLCPKDQQCSTTNSLSSSRSRDLSVSQAVVTTLPLTSPSPSFVLVNAASNVGNAGIVASANAVHHHVAISSNNNNGQQPSLLCPAGPTLTSTLLSVDSCQERYQRCGHRRRVRSRGKHKDDKAHCDESINPDPQCGNPGDDYSLSLDSSVYDDEEYDRFLETAL